MEANQQLAKPQGPAATDSYWMKARLLIRRLRPTAQTLATVERPFARFAADPRADVVMATGNASQKLFVIATGEGLRCYDLSQTAPPADSVTPSKSSVQWGQYAIEWISDATPSAEDRPATWPVVEFAYKGRVLAKRTLQRSVTILGRGSPSDLCVTHPEISRTHCALFWDNTVLWVIDLFSANGVYTSQGFADCVRLFPGGAINLGPVVMRLFGETQPADESPSEAADVGAWDAAPDGDPSAQADAGGEFEFSTPAWSGDFGDLDLDDDATSHDPPPGSAGLEGPRAFGGPLIAPSRPPHVPASRPQARAEAEEVPPEAAAPGPPQPPPGTEPLRRELSELAQRMELELGALRSEAHTMTSGEEKNAELLQELNQRLEELDQRQQEIQPPSEGRVSEEQLWERFASWREQLESKVQRQIGAMAALPLLQEAVESLRQQHEVIKQGLQEQCTEMQVELEGLRQTIERQEAARASQRRDDLAAAAARASQAEQAAATMSQVNQRLVEQHDQNERHNEQIQAMYRRHDKLKTVHEQAQHCIEQLQIDVGALAKQVADEDDGLRAAVQQLQAHSQALDEQVRELREALARFQSAESQQLAQNAEQLRETATRLQESWGDWTARREEEMVTLAIRLDDLEAGRQPAEAHQVEQPLRGLVKAQAAEIQALQKELAQLRIRSWAPSAASPAHVETPAPLNDADTLRQSRAVPRSAETDSAEDIDGPLAAFIEQRKNRERGYRRWYLAGLALVWVVVLAVGAVLLRPWLFAE